MGQPDQPTWFSTTHWTTVLAAGDLQSPAAAAALERLCRTYWYPLYAYLRRHGHPPPEAQDLTQAFFTRLIARNLVQAAQPARGRFRGFLLTCLRHFVADESERRCAAKRGSGCPPLPLDLTAAEQQYGRALSHDLTPERLYERSWALTVMEQVRTRLREEVEVARQDGRFAALEPLLAGSRGEPTHAEVAERLGLSLATVKADVHRLRRRYGEILRHEIAHTVADPNEIDEEIRHLMRVLSE